MVLKHSSKMENGKLYKVLKYNTFTSWYRRIDGSWELHREDGPAYSDYIGFKSWFLNGYRHREDGPAIIYPDGSELWYLKGFQLSKQEFLKKQKDKIIKLNNILYLKDGRKIQGLKNEK